MFTLSFNPAKLPRSMTRQEWKECHRWLRTVQRIVAENCPWPVEIEE